MWDLFINTWAPIKMIGARVGLCGDTVRRAVDDMALDVGLRRHRYETTETSFRRRVKQTLLERKADLARKLQEEEKQEETPGPVPPDEDKIPPVYTEDLAFDLDLEPHDSSPEESREMTKLKAENDSLKATLRKVASSLRYLDELRRHYGH
jgi:hypothetical protein